MPINDLYADGIRGGWRVRNAATFTQAQVIVEADVAIVGTGAGGGTAAEILSRAGLKVLLLEEGSLKTSDSFKDMDELRAFRELYQDGGSRTTADGAIGILQGRTVGGTTVVNFTSSFRTPAETLDRWARVHGVRGASVEEMAPWFARMEERLGVAPWAAPPNANNEVLKRACEKLGWDWHVIPRNVRGCWNSGYCGHGCPVNAKQSMLVTTIPGALNNGAELIHNVRIERVMFHRGRVSRLIGRALDADALVPTGAELDVRARHFVLAGGAINTPALLLRSGAPDPHRRLGKRTMIHPLVLSLGDMPEPVEGFRGAPQSIASDEFIHHPPADGPAYKVEVTPMFPALTAGVVRRHGPALVEVMARLPHLHGMAAALRDGFHDDSPGGEVRLADDGSPLLHYDMNDYLWRSLRHALLRMAEAQFAGGADRVMPAHLDATWYTSWGQARTAIERLPMEKFRTTLFTAHLMGGCAMGEDASASVVRSDGRHHQVENLSVLDGSVFPTSIGTNPQLSIYGITCRNATHLAEALGRAPSTRGA